jgi:hypothetical protein
MTPERVMIVRLARRLVSLGVMTKDQAMDALIISYSEWDGEGWPIEPQIEEE